MSKIIQSMALLILSCCPLWVAAGVSPVTLSFQNGTTSFATGSTGSANYLVSMDASTPPGLSLSLSHSDYSWVTQVTTGTSACTSPAASICATHFSLSPGGSCCLMLSLNGAGVAAGSYSLAPIVATTPATYQYTVASPTSVTVTAASAATLTESVSTLALSVNDTGTNAALTGTPRQVTITNSSTTTTATSVAYSSTTLPTGTTITSNATPNTACGDIAPLGTCILTITPGATPSDTTYDLTPTPITLTTVGSNTNTLTLPVSILTYGSVYQSGYVYSINDTTPNTGSVGGKVAALSNQAAAFPSGIAWDADPACATTPFNCTQQTNAWDFYYGQDLVTVPGSTNPRGVGTNGPGDTYQIFSVLNGNNGNTNNPANYAASLCTTYAGGDYTNWYLPALCEMGPASNDSGCTAGFQNMVSNLSALLSNTVPCTTPTGCLAGAYWSSTENSGVPQAQYFAWFQFFSAGGSVQFNGYKYNQVGVRCSRALTI